MEQIKLKRRKDKTLPKIENNVVLERKQFTLSDERGYYRDYKPIKKEKPIEVKTTKDTEKMFLLWNTLAEKNMQIKPIVLKNRNTKIFQQVNKLCKAYLQGTLPKHKEYVHPEKIESIDGKRFTVKDFENSLRKLSLTLSNPESKFRIKEKLNIVVFISGISFTGVPSILFNKFYSSKDNKAKLLLEHTDYIPSFVKQWEKVFGESNLTDNDWIKINKYLCWSIPYFLDLKKNFNSLSLFADEVDAMEFFTFGVLRKMQKTGKTCSIGILTQPFFQEMLIEFRKFHGFTV